MKKTFLWVVFFLYHTLYYAQSHNEAIIRPTPSIAELSTYNTIPVSIQTGIPEISYPLINLETGNKSVRINLGLSYHAANTSAKDWTSEVGKGWSFLSGGSISREIFGDFDESFDDSSFYAYQKNEFNDIYNFNIPGESGKFRFIRDIQNNTFELVKLTPFTSKIEYSRNNNQATLILDSFTITSETGIKYVFKDYDINLMNVLVWRNPDPEVGDVYTDQKYRSAFYLSSILDENGQELVKYTYLRDLKYTLGTNNQAIDTETNKLIRIDAKSYGFIEINYNRDESLRSRNDIFAINNVVLKAANNIFIKKYVFNYSYDYFQPNSWNNTTDAYRILDSFSQVDSNGKTIEKYTFYNTQFSYEAPFFNANGHVNGKIYNVYNVLNKVTLPTGGTIVYDFEMRLYSNIEGLPRIKNIKYFNSIPDNITGFYNIVPARVDEYDYRNFDNSGDSGYLVEGGKIDGKMANPVFIYKNVKVSQGNNIGYTKYYFKAPDAYPYRSSDGVWPNFNLTRGGLIDRKEIYNALNQKLSEDLFDYVIEEYNGPKYWVTPSSNIRNFYLKTSWIKNSKVTSRNYFDVRVVETKNEVFRNTHNNKPSLERFTSSDGSIQETSYQYAAEKNNQKLIATNMVGFPLETAFVVKKNNSDPGKLLSRSETKYENSGNYLPTSIAYYDSQNLLNSEVIFNQYDNKGNLEQYTAKDGIPVTFIWGYNKTLPIAMVHGATYGQIAPYITEIVTKSNATVISEQALQSALDLFRNNSNLGKYQITTYVYDSLSRIKSSTPPSGIREIYQYDFAGRLDRVEDENGKVIKKYEYNYKH
ncbi:RHS repeat protein [Chryseobacterium gallinarum]|uniref:RHS repeat protein n=1 Tax=Chryseobacterium gallinarum TaxID=1324352 RepID=A0ABX6KUV9_CHRGL|nr:RHS repeat protein [Chryseobacterium gallinarum]QIY92399.1 RHS repeat protein [Chryseobacterium gallinarum]